LSGEVNSLTVCSFINQSSSIVICGIPYRKIPPEGIQEKGDTSCLKVLTKLSSWLVSAGFPGRMRQKNAVEVATKTIKDMRVAEVIKLDLTIEDDKVSTYRTRLKASFKYLGF